MNCRAYSSFKGISSDHKIVIAKIRPSLSRNNIQSKPSAKTKVKVKLSSLSRG